jgi:hypothetical protein
MAFLREIKQTGGGKERVGWRKAAWTDLGGSVVSHFDGDSSSLFFCSAIRNRDQLSVLLTSGPSGNRSKVGDGTGPQFLITLVRPAGLSAALVVESGNL